MKQHSSNAKSKTTSNKTPAADSAKPKNDKSIDFK